MSDLPYMPLYVADYVGDTAHLTTLEHGAYLMLLFTYWMRQKALPDDPVKLARIAKVTTDEWASMADTMAEFFQIVDGAWSHKRVNAELERAKGKLQKASDAGRASAEARRNKRSSPDEPQSDARSTDVEQASNHKVRLGKVTQLEQSSSERDARARFEKFWEVWPHQVNRQAAEAVFVEVDCGLDVVLAGVARYLASRSDDQQWADPAKWLSSRRWEDKPAPRMPRPSLLSSGRATLEAKRSIPGKVYVMRHSQAGMAWENAAKKRGKSQIWDDDSGWYFDTEWPPDAQPLNGRIGQACVASGE